VLQVIPRADAGQARADDQDVEMFELFGWFHGLISAQSRRKINDKRNGPG
jgi:hypothetical protein